MVLVQCDECGGTVNTKAQQCPRCGVERFSEAIESEQRLKAEVSDLKRRLAESEDNRIQPVELEQKKEIEHLKLQLEARKRVEDRRSKEKEQTRGVGKCSACDGKVHASAESCPHCGINLKKKPGSASGGCLATSLVLLTVGVLFIWLMGGSGDNKRASNITNGDSIYWKSTQKHFTNCIATWGTNSADLSSYDCQQFYRLTNKMGGKKIYSSDSMPRKMYILIESNCVKRTSSKYEC